jgi:thiamine-phosphate pyrophosphorylase
VGQDDAPPWLARRVLGPDAIVGRSTHAPAQLIAAGAEPVDYLSAGPVNPTPTKPGRPGTGLGYLAEAAQLAQVPWFVTGGVTPMTVPAMVAAGARRFVVVRFLTESPDPEANAHRLAHAIDHAVGDAA